MCIVLIKKQGIELPAKDVLQDCFKANKDGAGFMFVKDNQVCIRKGFMAFDKFYEAITLHDFKITDTVVYHFRIATAGSINPSTCHPFPISNKVEDLKAISIDTGVGIAHNGCISINPSEGLSDTQEFIRVVMALPDICNNLNEKIVRDTITKLTTGSRLAILFPSHDIHLYGEGWIEDKGLLFSNNSHKNLFTWDKYSNWTKEDKSYWNSINDNDSGDYREDYREDYNPVDTSLIYNIVIKYKEIAKKYPELSEYEMSEFINNELEIEGYYD